MVTEQGHVKVRETEFTTDDADGRSKRSFCAPIRVIRGIRAIRGKNLDFDVVLGRKSKLPS